MKHILFINNLDAKGVELITEALNESRLEFDIKLKDKCIIIEGTSDSVYTAKTLIREAGYTIE